MLSADTISGAQASQDGADELNQFESLAFRLKHADDPPARSTEEPCTATLTDGFPRLSPDLGADPEEALHDHLLEDEDYIQSYSHRRTRRWQARRPPNTVDRPLRSAIGGRIGKAMPSHKVRSLRRLAAQSSNSSSNSRKTRRLLPARQFIRRKAPPTIMSLPEPVPANDIWTALLALPGFSFSTAIWEASSLGPRLGRLLADPGIVIKCGRSLKRRRLPNFLLLMLVFPMQSHHGRGTIEKNCSYAPGDEHDPAFWQRFAVAFGLWMGLQGGSQDEILQGGNILRDLVFFLSTSRSRFLGHGREIPLADEQQDQFVPLTVCQEPEPPGSQTPLSRRRRTIVGDETDDETTEKDHDDSGAVGIGDGEKLTVKTGQPTQLQRRVSVATDAWMLFLDKANSVDFDVEMLATMCI